MTDDLHTAEPLSATPERLARRRSGALRKIILPLLVIAAIVAAIWWLESRDDAGVSPSGETYGPVELPISLHATGLEVSPEEGSLAPDFLLEGLDGREVRVSDFRGQPVVLNFWASWCGPCRKEIPQFVDAYARFRDQGLVVIGVNMQEGKSIARRFADDYGMDFPIVIDVDGEVGDEYRLLGLPVTFFVDREGVVRSVFTGPFEAKKGDTEVRGAIEESELDQRIADILNAGAP